MRFMALFGEHPRWTKAIATKRGARPSPAMQCTPMRRSPVDLPLCWTVEADYFFSLSPVSSPEGAGAYSFFSNFKSPALLSPPLVSPVLPKNSSTSSSHFLIWFFSGSLPSGKMISYWIIVNFRKWVIKVSTYLKLYLCFLESLLAVGRIAWSYHQLNVVFFQILITLEQFFECLLTLTHCLTERSSGALIIKKW